MAWVKIWPAGPGASRSTVWVSSWRNWSMFRTVVSPTTAITNGSSASMTWKARLREWPPGLGGPEAHERVLGQLRPAGVAQGLDGVVALQLIGLGHGGGGAHRSVPFACGTQRVRAAGTTSITRWSRGSSSASPSRSTGCGVSQPTSIRRAWNSSSCGSLRRRRVTTRAARASQSSTVRVWSTATSSRPSSGRASGMTGSPPWSRPRLPIRTPWPVRSTGGRSSRRSWKRVARRRRFLNPLSTYATAPRCSFSLGSASRSMAASKPIPPMTTKRSSSMAATSRRTRSPVTATCDGLVELGGDVEVGGQQVAGAAGEHGQGHLGPGQAGDAGHHRAVAPLGDDQVDPFGHGLGRLARPGSSLVVSSHRTSRPAPPRAASVSRRGGGPRGRPRLRWPG